MRRVAVLAGVCLALGVHCATFVQPLTCHHDPKLEVLRCESVAPEAHFCQYTARLMSGGDCDGLNLHANVPFCVLTKSDTCGAPTSISVDGKDCSLDKVHYVAGPTLCPADDVALAAHS